jgi:hypothetical protein
MTSAKQTPGDLAVAKSSLQCGYVYAPLLHKTSFRVMRLLPGIESSKIEMELLVADWSAPPEYEAISYVWGDPNNTVSCFCDGKQFQITRSLSYALQQFREVDKPRILWADAVW